MTVGENIRLHRKMNNLSQAKLAAKLYVTPQAVSRWENNETQPDLDTLGKLAGIFGTTIDEIANGDESKLKGFRAEQAYHLLCLVGGSISTIFSVIFSVLMVYRGQSNALEIVYVAVSLLFLFSIFFFEIRSRRLNKKAKTKKEKSKNEITKEN